MSASFSGTSGTSAVVGINHYATVLESVPHVYHGGGGITAYAAVKAMRNRGHRVTIVSLSRDPKPGNDEKHIRELQGHGIEVHIIDAIAPPRRRGHTVFPTDADLFPGFLQRPVLEDLLQKLRPDAVFMYHWNALAAMHGITRYPKFGAVGDPAHLPLLFRSTFLAAYGGGRGFKQRLSIQLRRFLVVPRLKRMQTGMLRECNASGAFAAHHAELFRNDVPGCLYLRTPTPDPAPPPITGQAGGKFKIMHIGHLQGIATLTGVELLAYSILPRLKRILPERSFEVHLVGGFFEVMPRKLQEALRDPDVHIRGQITPADAEFISSDVVIVPTPIELGIRVRIITAFSFGSCIVAHVANAAGIPELKDGINCLLSDTGAGLADRCVEIYRNAELRKALQAGSRKTYEDLFSLKVAGTAIAQRLEALVEERSRVSTDLSR